MDLLSIEQLGKKQIQFLLSESAKMEKLLKKAGHLPLKGKLIANMFFEPSTRTNLSFQAACKRLGAQSLEFCLSTSSCKKGESFEDSIKMLDSYADAIIIRHPNEGSASLAAKIASHPVINAGDGAQSHPTQALIDLYTIKKLKGKIKGLNITLLGDLKHARAMRSLFIALAMFNAKLTLVSPPGLEMEKSLVKKARAKFKAKIIETQEADLCSCDILYTGRIQKERFSDSGQARLAQKKFHLSASQLKSAPKRMAVMHPLPRVDEIPKEFDSDPRAKYFMQAKNGVAVRMAILVHCLKK